MNQSRLNANSSCLLSETDQKCLKVYNPFVYFNQHLGHLMDTPI